MARREIKTPKCPKCGSKQLAVVEIWRNHTISFEQAESGYIDRNEGVMGEGEAHKVEAECSQCGNAWVLRGVTQITDLPEIEEPTP